MAGRLGIVAGGGTLPARLIERCREAGRDVYVLALRGQAEPVPAGVPHDWVRIGASEEGIRLLRAAGVTDLVMAGGIRRQSAAEMMPDLRAARVLARAALGAGGDDGLLRTVKAELESEGFTLIGPDQLLQEFLARDGTYGRHVPDEVAEGDIARGFTIVQGLGALDVGQAAIVQQGLVLGVEAIEGTDTLIERCGPLRREGIGGVLVKASKPKQERRIDLPTIGPETIERAAAAGLRGIAVEAGSTLVIDEAAVIERADSLGLFLVGRRPGQPLPLFYLIAGEPSGDLIGACLMRALRERTGGAVRFAGIGGDQMAAEGLRSLLPIRELAIMGLLEVLPAARRVFRRVRETAAEIERLKPDAVVTIDSSGFCFRVADRLRLKPDPALIVHYVAPMVWAWRRNRVKYVARAADHLLTLFPFEPPHFEAVGLATSFVGHPVIETGADAGDGQGFRARYGIDPEAPLLAILPGSRRGEVKYLLPVFRRAAERLASEFPGLTIVIPTVGTVADVVRREAVGWSVQTIVVTGQHDKYDAFAAATAALAASGTVSLELAMAGVPMVIAYRVWPLTAVIIKQLVRLPSVSLVNILLGRKLVPEYMQEKCTPEILSAAIGTLLRDPSARQEQRDGFVEALASLGKGGDRPSIKAADRILALVAARRVAAE